MLDYPKRLMSVLKDLPLESKRVDVLPGDDHGWRFLASVVSPGFRGMNSNERQRMVWQLLFDRRDDIDMGRVEFVYTDTPEEFETKFPNGIESIESTTTNLLHSHG